MPLFLIFIIFNNHSHSTIIHSFILHHSPRPVFLYPHRFFAQQEKNLHGLPSRELNSVLSYSKPTHYQLSNAAPSGTAILVSAEVSGLFGRKNPPSGTPILVPAGVRLFFSQDKTYSTEDKESYSTLAGVGLC
jgi:hypothetical protein